MTTQEKIEFMIQKGYRYDKSTGIIYSPTGHIFKNIGPDGYNRISVFIEKRYQVRAHQVAFYFVHGYIPKCIDHIDRDKLNNRIENLKDASFKENARNTKKKGYYFRKNRNVWVSRIRTNSGRIHLGSFKTEDEAREAYLKAKQKYHTN